MLTAEEEEERVRERRIAAACVCNGRKLLRAVEQVVLVLGEEEGCWEGWEPVAAVDRGGGGGVVMFLVVLQGPANEGIASV
jgi:hypothetical protein